MIRLLILFRIRRLKAAQNTGYPNKALRIIIIRRPIKRPFLKILQVTNPNMADVVLMPRAIAEKRFPLTPKPLKF